MACQKCPKVIQIKQRINILDTPNEIREKIKWCKTDTVVCLEWDYPDCPEATNLLNIYAAVSSPEWTHEDILKEIQDLSWGQLKPLLADAVVAHLEPIPKKYNEVRSNKIILI